MNKPKTKRTADDAIEKFAKVLRRLGADTRETIIKNRNLVDQMLRNSQRMMEAHQKTLRDLGVMFKRKTPSSPRRSRRRRKV